MARYGATIRENIIKTTIMRHGWIIFNLLVLCAGAGFAQNDSDSASSKPIDLRGVRIWRELRKIEISGAVNMQRGVVELLATAPGGKDHESIFVLYCNPSLLQTALLLIGLNPGSEGKRHEEGLDGDEVFIYVRWGEDERTARAEDFIWDQKRSAAMSRTHWIFTGSRLVTDPHSGKTVFMANVHGVLAATFFDPDAIINNPQPERNDDTVYCANPQTLPSPGTPVVLILSATPLENR